MTEVMEMQKTMGEQKEIIDLEIRCPPETRVLSHLRSVATAIAEEKGFSLEEIGQIEMAVDEACTNVVRHAYKHLGVSPDVEDEKRVEPVVVWEEDEASKKESKPICVIRMRITIGDDMLRFRIIDNGIGLSEEHSGVTNLEEYLEREGQGGLGIYIIKNFMDEVEYSFAPGKGTVLTMTKYLNKQTSNEARNRQQQQQQQ